MQVGVSQVDTYASVEGGRMQGRGHKVLAWPKQGKATGVLEH